jgi:hypothetical protein
MEKDARLTALIEKIESMEIDPYTACDQILEKFRIAYDQGQRTGSKQDEGSR